MSRFYQNGLAALAAIAIFTVSFSAMVTIPANPAFAAIVVPLAA